MTIINRIAIHGFKSFAHKTEVPLDGKYNCILGPNGSGKSNVGDALCFVLGRLSAKSMRAEKASNLIFNGGKDKKPATSAYVEIAFDNQNKTFPLDAKEVVVNRAINKDGSSTYRINGQKKTRTEVLDLLATAKINPDGYNIILQGDITRFVDMNPVERRKIIEEISDVSVYEEKKHKALLEMQKVEEKLNNAEIILAERKTYLKELKKDRDQALKFKDLKDKIDSHKATYLHLQMKEREAVKETHDKEIAKSQEKIKVLEEKVGKLRGTAEEHKARIAKINQEIEQKGEKEQVKVHKQLEDLKVSLAEEKTRVSALKDEINKIKQRKDQFSVEMQELEEKASSQSKHQQDLQQNINKKQKELQELEKSIQQFRKKHNIESSQELEKEIEQKEQLIEQKQEEIQQIRQKQQELLREKDQVEFQLNGLDERIKKVKEVEKENKQQMDVLQRHKNDFKAATLRLNKCLEQDSGFASQLGNARRKVVELQEKQSQLNARTLSYQANLATDLAVRSILENRKKFRGVHGTVAELGQADKKFAQALEASAGARMNNIVVEDDKVAADCIAYLKDNKLGSAAFIPLTKIKYHDITAEDKNLLKKAGVHDFALNLITFKPQYKKAFAYVFGKTIVVDNLDSARKIGVGTTRMVTMDGSLAEESGVMRGGFMARKASIGFKEKDSLEELEKVERELGEWQGVIVNVEQKREVNLQEISALRTNRAEVEAEVIKLEKSLHLDTHDLEASTDLKKELQARLQEVDTALAVVQKNVGTVNKDLAELKTVKQNLRSEVNQLRDPRLLAQLSAFEESRQKCREDTLRLESDLKNILTQMEQMLAPEKEKIKEILKQHDKEEHRFHGEINRLTGSIKEREKELEVREKESREFYSTYKELFVTREKLSAESTKAENEIESLREKSRESEREINLISLKNAEVKARLAGLQEEFARYKNAAILSNKNIEELKQEVIKFEVMLGQMSAVNMKALEVYEQVEFEFNKLLEKKDELGREKTDVLTLMNEIESKKKEHFMRTFNQANDNFQKIFSTLFTKGKAYLELENPNAPFEEGLSVKVKLAGNRFMDIKSLSGGEKTLTALSFIFAIQEYQPASFYILDEIDAALDKQNSDILSKLIRSYADRAQYIVISHNDAIISEADTLFGVSMKDGVSKITSLKI
ncbi:MAG TPA: chromosome segregation protein SMC [Candidatus Nanoarchaeia archaeon]|nr:chromosome segregation protein SMC [Candidatus Nanoarchaeia archaeon]